MRKNIILSGFIFFCLQNINSQVLEKTIEKINSLHNVSYKVNFYQLMFDRESTDTLDSYIKIIGDEKGGGLFKIKTSYSTLLYDGNRKVELMPWDSSYRSEVYKNEGSQIERSSLMYWSKMFATYLKSPEHITYLPDTIINNKKYFHLVYHHKNIYGKNTFLKLNIVIDRKSFLPYQLMQEEQTFINRDIPAHLIFKYGYFDYKINQKEFPDLSIIDIPPYFVSAEKKRELTNQLKTPPLNIGAIAPDFELPDVDDKMVRLKNIGNNKAVLIEFTFIGCVPCLAVIPTVKKIRKKYKGSDLEILSIYHQESSTKEEVVKLINKYELSGIVELLKGDAIAEQYHIQGSPTFFLVDKNGKIAGYKLGLSDDLEEQLIEKIDRVLDQ